MKISDKPEVKSYVEIMIIDKKTGKVKWYRRSSNLFTKYGATLMVNAYDQKETYGLVKYVNVYDGSKNFVASGSSTNWERYDTGERIGTMLTVDVGTDKSFNFRYLGLSYQEGIAYEDNLNCYDIGEEKTKDVGEILRVVWHIEVSYQTPP